MWSPPGPPANEAERLHFLNACGLMDTPPDERFDRITRLAVRIYDADVAFIGPIDAQFQSLISLTSDALGRSVSRRESVCDRIISDGKPMVVGDLKSDVRFAGHPLVPALTLRFYAGVPVTVAPSLVLGSLCVMKTDPQDADSFDLGPLTDLAAIAASEISHCKLNRELWQQAQTDSLTGLRNRRAFDHALAEAVRRTHRTGLPLSLLVADIDRFKGLNDLGSHQTGDQVLSTLGGLLAALPRCPLDCAARIGGDEFALILPDTDQATATNMAEHFLAKLRGASIPHPEGGWVTSSIGVATQSGDAVSVSRLFLDADAALYDAKHAGRDTVRSRQHAALAAV